MSRLVFVVAAFVSGISIGLFLTKSRRDKIAAFVRRMIWPYKARYIRSRTFAKVKKMKRKVLLLNLERSYLDVDSKKYKKLFSKEQKLQLKLHRFERMLSRQNIWLTNLK